MFKELEKHMAKPEIYAPGTSKFWDDEHISKGMLEAHLNPEWDAATRKPEFLDESVKWISQIAPPAGYGHLLDLGCGPGLYGKRFAEAGYSVTGIDFSKRSIEYAKAQNRTEGMDIEYIHQNYLTIDYTESFDVITIIYCDYPALPPEDRLTLLGKVYKALEPGGRFILDAFTPLARKEESSSWHYHGDGGFWSEKPHLCLESICHYGPEVELSRYIVVEEKNIDCHNIWNRFFTRDELSAEIKSAGFKEYGFYDDIAGSEFSNAGETICGVFIK
jgi:SAM-dependent methyltransferase